MSLMTPRSDSALARMVLREIALLGVEAGFEEEIGEADDAVHRRADLVAHVREEVALGAVGHLGVDLGVLEFLLVNLARGNIGVG